MKIRYLILIVLIGLGVWSLRPVKNNLVGAITCKAQQAGLLPDPNCTPGLANPNINISNYKQTICNPNWSTASIRPSSAYTTSLKIKQISLYGFKDTNTTSYEEDHLISLELGGNPTDPQNLWPESYPAAKQKDAVENELHKEVCTGAITLQTAQHEISNNWMQFIKPGGDYSSITDDDDN